MKLVVATCQFAIDRDMQRNVAAVLRQMRRAKEQGAQVVHFSESYLSGYAGVEFDSFRGFDWDLLRCYTREVMALAGELRLWVILGSSHALTAPHKPHNSLYIIDDTGRLVDRYDKCFC